VSLATVSRYLPKRKPDDAQQQRWMTFLRNHKNVIVFGEQHLRRLLRNHVVYYNAWREAA